MSASRAVPGSVRPRAAVTDRTEPLRRPRHWTPVASGRAGVDLMRLAVRRRSTDRRRCRGSTVDATKAAAVQIKTKHTRRRRRQHVTSRREADRRCHTQRSSAMFEAPPVSAITPSLQGSATLISWRPRSVSNSRSDSISPRARARSPPARQRTNAARIISCQD